MNDLLFPSYFHYNVANILSTPWQALLNRRFTQPTRENIHYFTAHIIGHIAKTTTLLSNWILDNFANKKVKIFCPQNSATRNQIGPISEVLAIWTNNDLFIYSSHMPSYFRSCVKYHFASIVARQTKQVSTYGTI